MEGTLRALARAAGKIGRAGNTEQVCMIKENQTTEIEPQESFSSLSKHAFPSLRPRNLRAIEIAEGALLADIGVIFQLLIKFLPVGGVVLQLLVPVIFAVIVLRRGLYVGCMSLCVALFVICIVMGPGGGPFFVLEAGAGIFLGVNMRLRLHPLLTFLLGVLGGGAALWAVLLFYVFVGGGALVLLRGMHQGYASFSNVSFQVARFLHLGGLWQQSLYPQIDRFVQWGFQHWPFFYYLISCLICVPLVLVVYFIVNFFLRVLGYQVRPFPGYLLEGWLLALVTGLFKLLPRRAFVRFSVLKHLKAEVRRLNIARLRQRRLERAARAKQGLAGTESAGLRR
jgi:hypothetical protein